MILNLERFTNGLESWLRHIARSLEFVRQTALRKVSSGSLWLMFLMQKLPNRLRPIGFWALAVLMMLVTKMLGTSVLVKTNSSGIAIQFRARDTDDGMSSSNR